MLLFNGQTAEPFPLRSGTGAPLPNLQRPCSINYLKGGGSKPRPTVKSGSLLSVFIHKVTHSHAHSSLLSMIAFVQSWVVATETIWISEPKIFTITYYQPIIEKMCWHLSTTGKLPNSFNETSWAPICKLDKDGTKQKNYRPTSSILMQKY